MSYGARSEEHTSELQSRLHLVCRLLLEKKKMPTRFLSAVKRSVNPDCESFNSFIQISAGVGWGGTRSGARAIANQGGRRGNGSFQQIRNAQGCLKGEVFFFNDAATPEIYTLSLHDALPI